MIICLSLVILFVKEAWATELNYFQFNASGIEDMSEGSSSSKVY